MTLGRIAEREVQYLPRGLSTLPQTLCGFDMKNQELLMSLKIIKFPHLKLVQILQKKSSIIF
jgi:hypothetical protein